MSQMTPACLSPREPNAGRFFELFQTWTPGLPTRHRTLVTNPATLYGFPN